MYVSFINMTRLSEVKRDLYPHLYKDKSTGGVFHKIKDVVHRKLAGSGHKRMSPKIPILATRHYGNVPSKPAGKKLTKKQHKILTGLKNKAAASSLNMAELTGKVYLGSRRK
jgi:hypothetical protein